MTRYSTATALAVILASSPALAEITPSSVWEQLGEYYEAFGLTVQTEAVEEAGDTVTVRGLVLSQKTPADAPSDAHVEVQFGDVVLNATGDGGVSMDLPDQSAMVITTEIPKPASALDTPADAEKMVSVTVELAMTNPGESITVREDGTGNLYEYDFPTLEVAVNRIVAADGKVIENPGKMSLTNFTGTEHIESGDGFKLIQTGAADQLTMNVDYADEQGAAVIVATMADLVYNADSIVPAGADLGANMAQALKAGLDVKGGFKGGATDIKIDVTNSGGPGGPEAVAIASTVESFSLDFLISEGRIGYSGTSGASSTDMTVPDLPFPISYGIDSAQFNLEMPVSPSEDPQPFAFAYGFAGLTLSEGIWGMFDPQSALPRDPANLTVDLSGTARLDVDIFDPEAMADPTVAPGEVSSVKINKIDLSALGATVSATGELNSPDGGDLTTPVGMISGRLTGINALFDKLSAAGLMPQDQAMGMRMMLAMFAKPDPDNADALTSEIEFKEGGSIFANGQQVK